MITYKITVKSFILNEASPALKDFYFIIKLEFVFPHIYCAKVNYLHQLLLFLFLSLDLEFYILLKVQRELVMFLPN